MELKVGGRERGRCKTSVASGSKAQLQEACWPLQVVNFHFLISLALCAVYTVCTFGRNPTNITVARPVQISNQIS
jgi:hypothetical protein